MDPTMFYTGVGGVITGIVLFAVGLWLHRKKGSV